jgi:hypothetical protein
MVERKFRPRARLIALSGLVIFVGITVITYLSSYISQDAHSRIFPMMTLFFWGVGMTAIGFSLEISNLESRSKVLEEELQKKG